MWKLMFGLIVLAAMVYIYIDLIRPKLHAIEELDPYFDRADERWMRWWETLRGWRVEAVAFAGIAVLELPDLIDLIVGANVVGFLPERYQHGFQLLLLVLAFVRAFVTKRAAERKLDEEGGA